MHPLYRLALGIFLLGAMLVAVAFALPQHVTVAREQVINVPESDVFPFVNNPRKFNEWQPWAAKDPETRFEYSGAPTGEGARMAWESSHPEVGSGTQEIVESTPNKQVRIALNFGDMGKGEATYRLEPYGAGTRVVWVFETDTGNNPLQRWVGLLLDRWVGNDFERGLENLKKTAESAS